MDENKEVIIEEEIVEEETPVVETEPEIEPEVEPTFEEKKDEEEPEEEEKCPECGKPVSECECDDEEKDDEEKKYNLEEIEEYTSLRTEYENLKSELENLNTTFEALKEEYNTLVQFKDNVVREQKEALINSFYMLDDEAKADVRENIDTYSLEDIEAKLCILCVRNKVNFSLDEDNKENGPAIFNLEEAGSATNNAPDWVKALQAVAKK